MDDILYTQSPTQHVLTGPAARWGKEGRRAATHVGSEHALGWALNSVVGNLELKVLNKPPKRLNIVIPSPQYLHTCLRGIFLRQL